MSVIGGFELVLDEDAITRSGVLGDDVDGEIVDGSFGGDRLQLDPQRVGEEADVVEEPRYALGTHIGMEPRARAHVHNIGFDVLGARPALPLSGYPADTEASSRAVPYPAQVSLAHVRGYCVDSALPAAIVLRCGSEPQRCQRFVLLNGKRSARPDRPAEADYVSVDAELTNGSWIRAIGQQVRSPQFHGLLLLRGAATPSA